MRHSVTAIKQLCSLPRNVCSLNNVPDLVFNETSRLQILGVRKEQTKF